MVSEKIKTELKEIAKKVGMTADEIKLEFMEIYNNPLLQSKPDSFRESYAFNQIKVKYRNNLSQRIQTVISKIVNISSNTYMKDGMEHTRVQLIGTGHIENDTDRYIINTIFIDKNIDVEIGKVYKYDVSSYGKPKDGIYTAFGVDNNIVEFNEDIDSDKIFDSVETKTLAEIYEELEKNKKWSGAFKAMVSSTNIATSQKTGREFGIISLTDDSIDSVFVNSTSISELSAFVNPDDITFSNGTYIFAIGDAVINDNMSAFGPTLNIRYIKILFDISGMDANGDIPEEDDDDGMW